MNPRTLSPLPFKAKLEGSSKHAKCRMCSFQPSKPSKPSRRSNQAGPARFRSEQLLSHPGEIYHVECEVSDPESDKITTGTLKYPNKMPRACSVLMLGGGSLRFVRRPIQQSVVEAELSSHRQKRCDSTVAAKRYLICTLHIVQTIV